MRYSGASLGYQLTSVLAGGLAPFIATALLARFGYVAVALYMVGMAIVAIVSVYLATETYQRDLNAEQIGGERAATAGEAVRG